MTLFISIVGWLSWAAAILTYLVAKTTPEQSISVQLFIAASIFICSGQILKRLSPKNETSPKANATPNTPEF